MKKAEESSVLDASAFNIFTLKRNFKALTAKNLQ